MINIITDITYDIIHRLNNCVVARYGRCVLSTTPSVKPRSEQSSMAWIQSSIQVTKLSRSFCQRCGGICSSAVSVSMQRDWINFTPYLWNCLKCSKKTCQTEQEDHKIEISKRHTVFFTRCATFCCSVGQRISVTRALSMVISITASDWPIVQITRRYILRYLGHIPARVTCSTCGPWRQIWQMQRKTRAMVARKVWLPILLTLARSVKLLHASWVSDTQHCSPYTLGN